MQEAFEECLVYFIVLLYSVLHLSSLWRLTAAETVSSVGNDFMNASYAASTFCKLTCNNWAFHMLASSLSLFLLLLASRSKPFHVWSAKPSIPAKDWPCTWMHLGDVLRTQDVARQPLSQLHHLLVRQQHQPCCLVTTKPWYLITAATYFSMFVCLPFLNHVCIIFARVIHFLRLILCLFFGSLMWWWCATHGAKGLRQTWLHKRHLWERSSVTRPCTVGHMCHIIYMQNSVCEI